MLPGSRPSAAMARKPAGTTDRTATVIFTPKRELRRRWPRESSARPLRRANRYCLTAVIGEGLPLRSRLPVSVPSAASSAT